MAKKKEETIVAPPKTNTATLISKTDGDKLIVVKQSESVEGSGIMKETMSEIDMTKFSTEEKAIVKAFADLVYSK